MPKNSISWPRIITRVAVFLIIGAVVNVAVAWTLVTYGRADDSNNHNPTQSEVEWWYDNAPPGIEDAPVRILESSGVGVQSIFMTTRSKTIEQQPISASCHQLAIGWPMLAHESFEWENGSRVLRRSGFITIRKLWDTDWMSLPIAPRWGGLIVNSSLYGVLCYAFWCAIVALRRRRRVRKGLCPFCKYPIGSSRVCTECGALVKTNEKHV